VRLRVSFSCAACVNHAVARGLPIPLQRGPYTRSAASIADNQQQRLQLLQQQLIAGRLASTQSTHLDVMVVDMSVICTSSSVAVNTVPVWLLMMVTVTVSIGNAQQQQQSSEGMVTSIINLFVCTVGLLAYQQSQRQRCSKFE